MDWKTFASTVLVGYAWPLLIVVIVVIFRSDVSGLIKRAKSVEIAGAKSEFADYAAAFGYVETQVSRLAEAESKEDREKLAAEIQKTSKELKGLHPLALAFLAEIGRGVSADSAWLEHGEHIIELKNRGFIKLSPDAVKASDIRYKVGDHQNNTSATLTKLGDEFLAKLGYTDRHTYQGD